MANRSLYLIFVNNVSNMLCSLQSYTKIIISTKGLFLEFGCKLKSLLSDYIKKMKSKDIEKVLIYLGRGLHCIDIKNQHFFLKCSFYQSAEMFPSFCQHGGEPLTIIISACHTQKPSTKEGHITNQFWNTAYLYRERPVLYWTGRNIHIL